FLIGAYALSTMFPYTTLFRSFLDLLFGGMPVADDRLLYLQGGVFVYVEQAIGQCAHGGATCLPQQQSGCRIGIDEYFFQRRYRRDRKSTRLNSSHVKISYAVF